MMTKDLAHGASDSCIRMQTAQDIAQGQVAWPLQGSVLLPGMNSHLLLSFTPFASVPTSAFFPALQFVLD